MCFIYYLERTKDVGLTYEGDDLALHSMTVHDRLRLGREALHLGLRLHTQQGGYLLGQQEADLRRAVVLRGRELMAGSEAAKEAVYHRRYQEELGYTDPYAPSVPIGARGGVEGCYRSVFHVM